jgi:hypothetical protein
MPADHPGFPEHWFPCPPYLQQEYRKRIALGRSHMASSRVAVCGLARDVERLLPKVIGRIKRVGRLFRDYEVVVYENDSIDGTLTALRAWQRSNPRVHVLSERLGLPRWGSVPSLQRAEQMAAHRNRYREHVADHLNDLDYVIALDMDLPRGFSLEGLANSFGYTSWDAMGSNGLSSINQGPPVDPMFYDAWAFRFEGDEQRRPVEEINRLRFHRGAPPLPVWSCFGGLAIYPMASFACGARYGGGDCEHVVFHRRMAAAGFTRQYLNPSQIVLYSMPQR